NKGVTNTVTETTTVMPAVDLSITKSASPNPVCARSWPNGGTNECTGGLTYTFVIGNSGIESTTQVAGANMLMLRDPLPAGVVFDSAIAPAFATCSVDPSNVLTCTGGNPIATSGTESYVLLVDDSGPQNASNIRVRDTLPAGTTFLSVAADHGFTCSYSAGVVECVGGSLLGTAAEFYPPFGAPGAD